MCFQNGDKLVIWDADEDSIEELKMDLSEYLESLRDKVLSKKLIYEDLLGLVSLT